MRVLSFVAFFLVLFLTDSTVSLATPQKAPEHRESGASRASAIRWSEITPDGSPRIHLYFFWSITCPHCHEAKPWLDAMQKRKPWLVIHRHEISKDTEAYRMYIEMARSIGQEARFVPAFFHCRQMVMGYQGETTTGSDIERSLDACHQKLTQHLAKRTAAPTSSPASLPQGIDDVKPSGVSVHVPWFGEMRADRLSLPLLTLFLGGMDAFNPCAFFVLLFLLSLLVNTKSRQKMLIIGGIFIFFSGALYFVFMAAWLNLFLWMGELRIVTILAGLVALLMAGINIKDFYFFKTGVSLSLSDTSKDKLFQRMRGLLQSTSFGWLILGTITLAFAANTYELLCTAGLPMVYTRVLTMKNLPLSTYYFYLLLYNIVYVIPLTIIVGIFTYTLGRRKLQESEGRFLKLLSGLMMLGLGGVILLMPQLLNHLSTSVILLIGTLLLALLLARIDRALRPHLYAA
jgi:hypothetical protein